MNARTSNRDFQVWHIVTLTVFAVYCLYPYLSRIIEFSHNDITYNYGPFRDWLHKELRSGKWPAWDPFTGIGRPSEIWTSVPIDILTPIQLFFKRIELVELTAIQFLVCTLILTLLSRRLLQSSTLGVLATILFLCSPATAYFQMYYITAWSYLMYACLLTGAALYVFEERRKWLYLCFFAPILFIPGAKLEYTAMVLASTLTALGIICFFSKRRYGKSFVIVSSTILAGVMTSFWSYNLVLEAAAASLRPPQHGFDPVAMLQSLGFVFMEPAYAALIIGLTIWMLDQRRPLSSPYWKFAMIGLVAFQILLGWDAGNLGYRAGIIAATVIGLRRILGLNSTALVLLQMVSYYFLRPGPGEVDELLILQKPGVHYQFLTALLAASGPIWIGFERTVLKVCAGFLAAFILLRGVGLPVLSYSTGFIWLPARDNFLADLPLAILSSLAFGDFLAKIRSRLIFLPSSILVALLIWHHPTWLWIPDSLSPRLMSEKIKEDVDSWLHAMARKDMAPIRLLSYFHGFGRQMGLADVREYQSLNSRLYGRYSISARLGVDISELTNVGTTTGALSERFLRLIPASSSSNLDFIGRHDADPEVDRILFYFSYVVQSVPALECDHLRLFGVQYVEWLGGRYHMSNEQALNRLYSLTKRPDEKLDPALLHRLDGCGEPVEIGGRNFLRIQNTLPRSYAIDRPVESIKDLIGLMIDGKADPASVDLLEHKPGRIKIQINSAKDGVVVFGEQYSKNWKAFVDGNPVQPVAIGGLFIGVPITANARAIRLIYPMPNAALIWMMLLAGTALFWITMKAAAKYDAPKNG